MAGMAAIIAEELLLSPDSRQEPRAKYILDHASPWLNGKVQTTFFHLMVSEIESTNRGQLSGKGEDGQVCRPIVAEELLVESNFQQEPRAQYDIGSCLALAQWKGRSTFFHMVVSEIESTNRGQL